MKNLMASWNLVVLAALIGAAAAACSDGPKIQHAQCASNQVETPDLSASQSGSGCGGGETIVMKCVDVSSGTATGNTNTNANTNTNTNPGG
ncbi:MAG: hypothetical protein NTY77_05765 [Elusimicrobia bacterium]|nr:hypothetical protein [Elusimicrobiota bacterium]